MSKADATDWLRKNRLTGPLVVNRSKGLDFLALGVAGALPPLLTACAFCRQYTGRRLSALSPFIFLVEFGAEALDFKTR
jgi:hypothetical protein